METTQESLAEDIRKENAAEPTQEMDTLIPLREGNPFNVDAMEKWLMDNFHGEWWYHPTWFKDSEGNLFMKMIKADDPEMSAGLAELQALIK